MDLKNYNSLEKGRAFNASLNPLISPKAQIGKNVEIGPYSIIGDDVIIGDNTKIGPNVYIPKDTIIGENNQIYYGAVIGTDPQDLKYEGERSQLIIGNNNIIREYANISRGTKGGGYTTRIGNDNFIMGNTHIAHDVQIGNHNIIAHYTGLAGHVVTGDFVTIGGNTGIHQFCKIGSYSMIGGCSRITKDVLPYSLCQGNPADYCGLNLIGLRRRYFSFEQRKIIQKAFKIINNNTLTQAECTIELEKYTSCLEQDKFIINILIAFVKDSSRGFYKKNES